MNRIKSYFPPHFFSFQSCNKNEKQEWQIIDIWRDARSKGIKARFKNTNIILQGGVDDVWFNTKTKELIIVDYKSQASNDDVSQDTYFQKWHHDGYKTQLNFYENLTN